METRSKLGKKSITIVDQACHEIRGFGNLYQQMDDKVRLSGHSLSTLSNYARKLAQLSLHFGKLPQFISEKELNKYLASLARQSKSPSLSDFKFTVYGLRYCYRLLGMEEKVIKLPSIKRERKLPVVLNYQESYTQMLAETGMVAVLHTWGQNLSLHPHLHCIVPGGGIDYKGNWKQVKVSEKGKAFLFHVKSLSRVFRAKLVEALQKKIPVEKNLVHQLYKTPWVIYARRPFAGAQQVVEYLGRYTHKVAISNHRIIHIDENGVTFNYRDYRDNHKKQMTLGGVEFLRRFSQHILPKGFVRIRHYGLLSTARRNQLRELQNQLGGLLPDKTHKKDWKQICREYLDYDPDQCPCCHKGKMITVQVFLPGRAPPPLSGKYFQTMNVK